MSGLTLFLRTLFKRKVRALWIFGSVSESLASLISNRIWISFTNRYLNPPPTNPVPHNLTNYCPWVSVVWRTTSLSRTFMEPWAQRKQWMRKALRRPSSTQPVPLRNRNSSHSRIPIITYSSLSSQAIVVREGGRAWNLRKWSQLMRKAW